MKKVFALLALLTMMAVGQAGEQWKTTNYRSEGFTAGLNFGLWQCGGLQMGWQFGPHWNAGIELTGSIVTSSVDVRYYVMDRRNTPYVEAKASWVPTLQVGFAFGKLEMAVGGAMFPSYSQATGMIVPLVMPSFTVGYTFTFGKW